jgi:hypothetical protein
MQFKKWFNTLRNKSAFFVLNNADMMVPAFIPFSAVH